MKRNDIGGKYIRGQLTPEEAVEFEEYLIDKPELIEQLEVEAMLLKNLPKAFAVLDKQECNKKWFSNISWQVSFAALVVCVFGFQLFYNTDFGNQNNMPEATANVELIYLEAMRSQETKERIIALSKNDKFMVLVLQPSDMGADDYDIIIKSRVDGKTVLKINRVEPKGEGDIIISLPTELIMDGSYMVEMTSRNNIAYSEKLLFGVTYE